MLTQSPILKMEAEIFSKTSINCNQHALCETQRDGKLHSHLHKNLKCRIQAVSVMQSSIYEQMKLQITCRKLA